MIYAWHSMQQSLAAPLHSWAETTRQWFPIRSARSHTPASSKIAAGSELFARLVPLRETFIQPFPCHHRWPRGGGGGKSGRGKPFCKLLNFQRCGRHGVPAELGRAIRKCCWWRCAVGHHATLLRDTVRGAAGARRLCHRLDRRAPGAAVARQPNPSPAMSITCRSSSACWAATCMSSPSASRPCRCSPPLLCWRRMTLPLSRAA